MVLACLGLIPRRHAETNVCSKTDSEPRREHVSLSTRGSLSLGSPRKFLPQGGSLSPEEFGLLTRGSQGFWAQGRNTHLQRGTVRPISLQRLPLQRSVDSTFLGKSLWTWEFHPLLESNPLKSRILVRRLAVTTPWLIIVIIA